MNTEYALLKTKFSRRRRCTTQPRAASAHPGKGTRQVRLPWKGLHRA